MYKLCCLLTYIIYDFVCVFFQDDHSYYKSLMFKPTDVSEYWIELKDVAGHSTLSNSHRTAVVRFPCVIYRYITLAARYQQRNVTFCLWPVEKIAAAEKNLLLHFNVWFIIIIIHNLRIYQSYSYFQGKIFKLRLN